MRLNIYNVLDQYKKYKGTAGKELASSIVEYIINKFLELAGGTKHYLSQFDPPIEDFVM